MEYIYIKKSVRGQYRSYPEQLDPALNNNIGSTYEDYLNDKWVLLSAEQIAFHEANPSATIEEVWNMELAQIEAEVPEVNELEDAKMRKIQDIRDYDNSPEVNSFTIGDKQMWLDFDQRSRIRTSLDAYKATGASNMTKWFDGVEYTFTIQQWEGMLNMLEIYADEALNVTEAHIAAVSALDTVEAVEAYDITANYPTKLIF